MRQRRIRQFCAVARALDVLGERWTLLIVRELLLGASSFSEIRRGPPRIPRATVSSRLRTLRAAGFVDDDYRLTEAGPALAPVVRELARRTVITENAALAWSSAATAASVLLSGTLRLRRRSAFPRVGDDYLAPADPGSRWVGQAFLP